MEESVPNFIRIPNLIPTLSYLIQSRAALNSNSSCLPPQEYTSTAMAFRQPSEPLISVQNYLERIFVGLECSPSCYIVAYIYLDRFLHLRPDVVIDPYSVRRLIITTINAACKFIDGLNANSHCGVIGEIELEVMESLEVNFLRGIDYRLFVTQEVFDTYCKLLLEQAIYMAIPPSLPKRLAAPPEEEEEEGDDDDDDDDEGSSSSNSSMQQSERSGCYCYKCCVWG